MKKLTLIALALGLVTAAHARSMTQREIDTWWTHGGLYTATVKCAGKAMDPESFVGVSTVYLDALKAAIDKAKERYGDENLCFSVEVHPQPESMSDCDTKSCRPGYGGWRP